jgi:uncharacterized membrane protein
VNRLEQQLGAVLRLGTIVSSALFAIGLLLILGGYTGELPGILLSIALVVLIATPPMRVVVSVIEYVRERDWTFVVLTMIVLLALAGSVVAARF